MSTAYWDDYGIVAFDRTKAVSNAEAFEKMLGMQGVEGDGGLDIVPLGRLADYYIAPMQLGRKLYGTWQGSGSRMQAVAGDVSRAAGVTRVILIVAPGEVPVTYPGSGLVMKDFVLMGYDLTDARIESWPRFEPLIARCVVQVETSLKGQVDSGKLTTVRMSFIAAKEGIVCGEDSAVLALHADNCVHYSPWFDRIGTVYHVKNNQSVDHVFYDLKIWQHAKRGFVFDAGGHLRAYGASVNFCYDFELLYLGKPTSNGGNFDVHGISTDASCRDFRLLNHGKYAPRVRMSGMIAKGTTLAVPPVLDRDPTDSRFKNIELDVNHGYTRL